jgi:pimeloyl-ACP methyl ester carboxylesterase
MPLLAILRFLFSILSIAILAGAIYLLWTWYDAPVIRRDDGSLVVLRENWRLWLALPLAVWSLVGGWFWPFILARPDRDATRAVRGAGVVVPGPNGANLFVESSGPVRAPAIVLTHGSAMDSTIWYYAKRALSDQFRVVAWDIPGYGRSTIPSGADLSLEFMASNLAAVVDFVGAPVVVVGHSMGGMIIQTLAKNSPHLFGSKIVGAVLLNTTHANPLKTMIFPRLAQALRPLLEVACRLEIWLQPIAWFSAWQSYLTGSAHMASRVAFGSQVERSQLNHVTLLSTRNRPATIARGNLAMFRWDATGALRNVSAPALVIGGTADIVTKSEASETIASASRSARLELQPTNHMGFLELHERYNSLISQFANDAHSLSRRARSRPTALSLVPPAEQAPGT